MDQNSPVKLYAQNSLGNTNAWEDFFPSGNASKKYGMEATTHHIFQDKMFEYLRNRTEDFKLIVLLREPADRIRSSFYYTKFNASYVQDSISFDHYVNDLLHNNPMDYITNESSSFVLENELNYSTYIDHLRKYKSYFDNGNLYVGVFEEMKANPVAFYTKLFTWLNLEMNSSDLDLAKKNQTYQPKSSTLQTFVARFNRAFNNVPFKSKLKSIYFKYFTDQVIASDDSSSISRLKEYFKDHNQALEQEFGLDISVWN